MKVAIPGGTGLIGRELTRVLLQAGHQPVILSRSTERASVIFPQIEVRKWDARSVEDVGQALIDTDAVVNLMGEPIAGGRWTAARKQAIRDSRVRGTSLLVEALSLLEARPRVLVAGSAVGYYGSCGDRKLDEQSPPGTDFLAGICRDLELEAAKAVALGLRVINLRIGVVLSLSGGALPRMLPPFKLGLGGRLGSGAHWFPWIHRRDLCGIVLHCLDHREIEGPVNGTAPGVVTNGEFTRVLGRVLGRPTLLPMPVFALRLIFGELAGVLTASQRVVPGRAVESGYDFQFGQLDKALADCLSQPAALDL